MKNKAPVKLGPLALLLTVITICLAILAILTFSTAEADLRLAETSAETVQEKYEREAEGQQFLADAYAVLAQGLPLSTLDDVTVSGDTVTKSIGDDSIRLVITLQELPDGGLRILSWNTVSEWEAEQSFGSVWLG